MNNNKRPSMESTRFNFKKILFEIRQNISSLRQGLLLSSVFSIILGFLVWIFFRDLSTIGLWIMLAGFIFMILIAINTDRSQTIFSQIHIQVGIKMVMKLYLYLTEAIMLMVNTVDVWKTIIIAKQIFI